MFSNTDTECLHVEFFHSQNRFSEVLVVTQACWKQAWCLLFLVALLSLALLALASDPASTVMFTHFCFASEGNGLSWWGRYCSVREKKGNCENPYLLYLTLIFHQWETVVASPWANDCNYFRQDLRALPCLWLYLSSWNADTVRCFELEA